MKLEEVIWSENFAYNEFPGEVIKWIEPSLLQLLVELRERTGVFMEPSQLERAHARSEESTSQHSTMNWTIKSKASDMQTNNMEHMLAIFTQAQRIEGFGGIGVYFDTNRPTLHFDIRESRVLWVRDHFGVYHSDAVPSTFYRELGNCIDRS